MYRLDRMPVRACSWRLVILGVVMLGVVWMGLETILDGLGAGLGAGVVVVVVVW